MPDPAPTPGAWRPVWLVALALSLHACASTSERAWHKADVNPAVAERDEAECLTAAGVERVPRAHAGTAAMPGREADFAGRGYAEYVTCMESRGYTRANR